MTMPISTPRGHGREFEATLHHLPVAIALFRFDGQAIFMNDRFRQLYHVDETWSEEGTTFEKLIANGAFDSWKKDPAAFFATVKETLRRDGSFEGLVESQERIVHVRDVLLEDDIILTMQEDVTAKVLAEREVMHLARHDSLTNLPNRATLRSELERRAVDAFLRRQQLAVLAIDVDRFKDINDVFGHAAGDAVLGEIARRFRNCLADDDVVARLGGDEFMLISGGAMQPASAIALAGRLTEEMAAPVEFDGQALSVGISVGIAVFPDDGESAAALIRSADAALYKAKEDGRGTTRIFDASAALKVQAQRLLLCDLRDAVRNGELQLMYQPQATAERQVFGFEALLRWRHPVRGLVSPADFIPLAEESGLIVEIGRWVLQTACTEAAGWPNPLRLSVNLSPVQFRYHGLVDDIGRVLSETGLDPRRLELEVTEGVLIRDASRALTMLRELKEMGLMVAMDDFGTGYSSLSYLQAFPFDTIKIDKSFVLGLEQDHQAREIVRAVVALGRGLNIPIVAEGVETERQFEFLHDARCNNVQGYLIGRPLPIAEYAGLVGRGASASAA